MVNPNRFLNKLAIVLAVAVVGALLTTGLDVGGTPWIKFVGYVIFFASMVSASILFPNSSCSFKSRLRRRR